ncbi:MAG: adenosylcobinamide-GDP ribazoletransferase [Pseudomonadota bacterium]
MTRFLRHYLLALQFFTRVPVTGRLADWVGYSPAMLRASAAHFPGVGWLVGALVAGLFLLLMAVLPSLPAAGAVAAVGCMVFTALLTGAFHEDGLADLADGLGGSLERERALDIMKDSRIGSYGALALGLALMARVALITLLAQIAPMLAAAALFGAHVTSRLMPLFIVRTLPHVGDTAQSRSKPLADQISGAALAAALVWWAAAMGLLAWRMPTAPWGAGVLGALLGLGWMWRLLRRRLAGFTGDGLGATQQVCEVCFYLALLVAWRPPMA